ncbi:cardiolipin synthase [Candidatus Tachikawaea gelatinosa]|uniref:Cardiolipin synthase n=2 Tax=Candidatus Tachikawaea gelatinosa TaxID=1410383 RepID=A0A090AM89_9ENTR|nr:cardiolipin synthase [Candidatus Tachikawaea gelatinosa]
MKWLLIIYFLMSVKIICYLLIDELYIEQKRSRRSHAILLSISNWYDELKKYQNIFTNTYSNVAKSLFKFSHYRQKLLGVKGKQLKIFTHAQKIMHVLIRDILLARNSIKMIFYIWYPGGLADEIAKSLILASKRGISCKLILDSVGSFCFFKSFWAKKMRDAGIDIVAALKINIFRIFSRRIDIRQHRKIVLIDNNIAYTGSMNLADPFYFKQKKKVGQWIDIMIRLKGPIVIFINVLFACDWEIETGEPIQLQINDYSKKKYDHVIQMVPSGPGYQKNILHRTLLTAIYSSHKQLTITTPYFVPSARLLEAICKIAIRGIDVRIIIPKNNDSFLVTWASRSFFSDLLNAGVKIYQFEGGLLHTKSLLIDQQLSLVGTANFDMRSLWLNFEITLVIDDRKLGKKLYHIHNEYIAKSTLLNIKIWSKRSWWKRIIERLFYFFSPLL